MIGILKDDAVKVLHSYVSKFGKLSSGHRTGKGLFSFQSQRTRVPRFPAAGGSASLLAGPQSGPHHVPQSPETPHAPSGPELRPVTGDTLS